ncbi:hypothetical protein Acr_00g0031260 [Actinidia rufa]|uniref:Uncharacterized protein n=1 Tax=Actinidia rufa TaxID=165716 RepID=A0A7J0DF22_9ERIC|nr:hypothetical protein Acr_00g0031260 [Actinidia rufa]
MHDDVQRQIETKSEISRTKLSLVGVKSKQIESRRYQIGTPKRSQRSQLEREGSSESVKGRRNFVRVRRGADLSRRSLLTSHMLSETTDKLPSSLGSRFRLLGSLSHSVSERETRNRVSRRGVSARQMIPATKVLPSSHYVFASYPAVKQKMVGQVQPHLNSSGIFSPGVLNQFAALSEFLKGRKITGSLSQILSVEPPSPFASNGSHKLENVPLDICGIRLDGTNYLIWSRTFTLAIEARGMSEFIEELVTQPKELHGRPRLRGSGRSGRGRGTVRPQAQAHVSESTVVTSSPGSGFISSEQESRKVVANLPENRESALLSRKLIGNAPQSRRKRAPNSQSPTGAMVLRFDTDEDRFDFERLPLCSVTLDRPRRCSNRPRVVRRWR